MANGFESAARAKKTLALVGAIDRNALKQGKNPFDQSALVLLASYSWGADVWRKLADMAGVNMPSAETIRAVQSVYRDRATRALEKQAS